MAADLVATEPMATGPHSSVRMSETSISTVVAYQFSEYISFVQDYVPFALSAKKLRKTANEVVEPSVQSGVFRSLLIRCAASVAYVYKARRVGTCRFEFSSTGVTRHSNSGVLEVPWPQVERVFRLSQGYLFAKTSGAMPVPYRCLSAADRAALEALLSAVGHGHAARPVAQPVV